MANGYGNGSIVQLDKGKDGNKPKSKCRRWRLVVSLGRDPKTRRYRQRAHNFSGTYTEAQAALRDFREKVVNGEVVGKTRWTFDEYAKHYVDAREAAGEIEQRTVDSHRCHLRQLGHLIGGLNMQEITPQVVERAYIDLRNGESISGRPLSGRTIYNINLSAYLMFLDAKKKGVIAANPLDGVPRPKREKKERRALSAEAYRSLLASLDPTDHMECAVLLCAALGLRRSESLAVSWGDVDFAAGTIDIHASCDERGNLKKTKTEAGNRILPMPPRLADALIKRKAALVARFAGDRPELTAAVTAPDGACPPGAVELGGGLYDLDPALPVAADGDGRRCTPHALSAWWNNHRGGFGLADCTLHGLRHTFLSLAAINGVHPAVMQQLAGHNSAQTTMDIYTHVNMDSKRAALMVMQDAFMQ